MFVNVTRITLSYGTSLEVNLTVEFPHKPPFGFAFKHMVKWALRNNAFFIYPEPMRMLKNESVYDRIAGNLTHEICNCIQNIIYDSNSEVVIQVGANAGKILLNNSVIVLFGGPYPNLCVLYYESINATPLRFFWNKTEDTFNFISCETGKVIASMPRNADFEYEDMFIM